jgi:hypothetical protein
VFSPMEAFHEGNILGLFVHGGGCL